jgi:hypothetical protein
MSKKYRAIVAALAALAALAGCAGEEAPADEQTGASTENVFEDWVDYCGQDPWSTWVPDRPANYNFRLACYNHDNCRTWYADTRSNALYCHDRFYQDMASICANYPSPQREDCLWWAGVYHNAVKAFNTPLQ